MQGKLLGACSCDWGCPCNFDALPSQVFCEGVYLREIIKGRYGDVSLDGVRFIWAAHAPGAVHEGNLVSLTIVDDRATPEQQEAILTLQAGNGVGSPFDVFASVTSRWLDPIIAPIDISWDGIRSTAKVGGGSIYDIQISRIANPVTGDEEELYLDKPTGFTSLRSELGMSKAMKLSVDGLSFDHGGKYAEYAEFSHAGP